MFVFLATKKRVRNERGTEKKESKSKSAREKRGEMKGGKTTSANSNQGGRPSAVQAKEQMKVTNENQKERRRRV